MTHSVPTRRSSDRGECPRRVILAHVFAVVVHILSLPAHPQAPAEPQIAGQLAGKLTALVDAPLKPQLATTAAQERFNLGIALKAFRHDRHFLPRDRKSVASGKGGSVRLVFGGRR